MKRWLVVFIWVIGGLGLVFLGLQLPAHLHAVDVVVLQNTGANTPSLLEDGLRLTESKQLGAAELLASAARNGQITNHAELDEVTIILAQQDVGLKTVGRIENGKVGEFLRRQALLGTNVSQSLTGFIVRAGPQTQALELLRNSASPLVQALLNFRTATNTVIFPPSASSSGQALDTAICIAGLLTENEHITIELRRQLLDLASGELSDNSQRFEQALMDLMSLGQRLNWGQLVVLVGQIYDLQTLQQLANLMQQENVPAIFSAIYLTKNAAGVTRYLAKFSQTGINDLRSSLVFNAGGVNKLLQRNQQLCNSKLCQQLAASGLTLAIGSTLATNAPSLALAFKWLLYLLGGFSLAVAVHFVRRVQIEEEALQGRRFHVLRESLFALGFLLVVLLLSEPFFFQDSQTEITPLRLRLPTMGNIVPAGNANIHSPIMNQLSLLALLFFFVLQGLIYIACLVKLAEIRRQNAPVRLRLKLLENEEHLFDAGLYLGFVGTIISLILVSLGVIKPSLMAAYSSTSFGIIFVSIFKIFHLRPLRRKLLLESEAAEPPPRVAPTVGNTEILPP